MVRKWFEIMVRTTGRSRRGASLTMYMGDALGGPTTYGANVRELAVHKYYGLGGGLELFRGEDVRGSPIWGSGGHSANKLGLYSMGTTS